MNRRDFLKTSTAVAASLAAAAEIQATPPAKTTAKTRRPNILYVFSDQHRACSTQGESFNQALAPNLARFRDKNVSMQQCVSNYPLCTPYRAIFMSGLYPQQSGVMGNVQALDPKCGPLGETFRNAGYHTGYVGKWHIHGQDRVGREDGEFIPKGPLRMGFEDWHVWANTNDHWNTWTFDQDTGEKIVRDGWNASFMTDEAIAFMKAQPAEGKPWFLVVSWNPPHPPFDPPAEDANHYAPDQIKFRPNMRIMPDGGGMHKGVRSEERLRQSSQRYMGAITAIDLEFARVLQALEETGQADDTIVIYSSDHGEMMGSQGMMGKRVPFEESCHVPFYVRYPGLTPEGHKSNVLLGAIDIYPTLCGLAGVSVPAHCAGRNLSDALLGRDVKEPDYVFMLSQPEPKQSGAAMTEEAGGGRRKRAGTGAGGNGGGGGGGAGNDGGACPPYRGVRTKTHTYIVAASGRWLLYDNIRDPYQMTNLITDKSQAALMAKLDIEIEKWLHSVEDSFPYASAKTEIFAFA